jgi:type II secretory pathway pseudopilin PulG
MMRARQQHGFLLLEVIFATMIVAISLVAIMEGLNRCLAAARSVQNYTISNNLLANKAYEFRVERPTDYLDQEGKFDDYPGYSWSRTLTSTETEFLWEQKITVFWWERGRLASDSVVEYRYLPQKQS